MMKQLLIALMLLVTATAASAEWTAAGDSDEFIQYVDIATIRRNGNFVEMWSLTDFKTVQKSAAGKSYSSEKQQAEYDCKEKKKGYLGLALYAGKMGSGKDVFSTSETSMKWFPIGRGGIGETEWKIACGKQ